MNNIKVSHSNIGVLNTGSIQKVDSALTVMQQIGEPEMGSKLKAFSQSVIDDSSIPPETKDRILELLSFVAEEATVPKAKQRPTIVRPILAELASVAGGIATVSKLWDQLAPFLHKVFSFPG